MKVEFQLTFEDYCAASGGPLATRGPDISTIVALVGFLSLAYGYFDLRSAPQSAPPASFVALGLGILLPVLSVLAWIWRRSTPSKRKVEAARRSLYERYDSGQRSFTADDLTWTFAIGSHVFQRSWADLTGAQDKNQRLIFSDVYDSHVLPKAALTADQQSFLDEQIQLALVPKEKLWSVAMIPSANEYAAAMAVHNWKSRTWRMLTAYGLGLAVVSFVAIVVGDAWVGAGPPALTLFLICMPFVELRHYRKLFDAYLDRSFQSVDILNDRMCFNTGGLHNHTEMRMIKYHWVAMVRETRRVFLVYTRPGLFFLIPKAGFKPVQVEEFRRLLRMGLART